MFVLIDESLPGQLRNALPSHDARTVVQMGWRGTKNGELLRRADAVGLAAPITLIPHRAPKRYFAQS